METDDKNPGEKKWNNEQKVNEGFSAENLPENYNDEKQLLSSEIETDELGNETEVKRARFPHQHDENFVFDATEIKAEDKPNAANPELHNKKSLENRDRNSDIATNRYPHSNPESHRDRGNFDVNES